MKNIFDEGSGLGVVPKTTTMYSAENVWKKNNAVYRP